MMIINTEPMFCLFALIKNEQLYLDEWIQYHTNLGIQKIILIEDTGSRSHKKIVDKYDNVELIPSTDIFSGSQMLSPVRQRYMVNWFVQKYAPENNIDWGFDLDIDEYLHLEIPLIEFANRYKDYPAVHLYWKCYNANGHYKRESGTQYELYANDSAVFSMGKAQTKLAINIKKPSGVLKNIHQWESGVDVDEQIMTFSANSKALYKIAWVDHFVTRSYEDWEIRIKDRPSLNSRRNINTFWKYNPDMKRLNPVQVNILIIHYNTPDLTKALIGSINKWVPECNIFIFDNSDKHPFTYRQDNITYFDNTKGQLINFDAEIEKMPFKEKCSKSNYGSFKHSLSVQKCMDMLDVPVILMDSDILLKKDISVLFNDYNLVGGTMTYADAIYKRIRLLPLLCFLNFPYMKQCGLHYHYPDCFIDVTPMSEYAFDTGGLLALIVKTQYFAVYQSFDWHEYAEHYGHASWDHWAEKGKLKPEDWLEEHHDLYK